MCQCCGKAKEAPAFQLDRRSPDGLFLYCLSCTQLQQQQAAGAAAAELPQQQQQLVQVGSRPLG